MRIKCKVCGTEANKRWIKGRNKPSYCSIPCRDKDKPAQLKAQYASGARDPHATTQVANQALRDRTSEREEKGEMTVKINHGGYREVYTIKGWQREHRYLWEKAYGPIPKDHVLHHINLNKEDNRLENLRLMRQDEHMRLHEEQDLHRSKFTGQFMEKNIGTERYDG